MKNLFQVITYDVIITCIDTFFFVVDKPTVIIAEKTSIHTSDAILDKLEEWKERTITIFELPSYSLKLDWIEIWWQFIKYESLEIDAYKT